MKSPILNWICGSALVLGLPPGVLCVFSSGSLLVGIVSMVTVVLVVLLACRKDIIREYNEKSISHKMARKI
jgi:hypothetical protein